MKIIVLGNMTQRKIVLDDDDITELVKKSTTHRVELVPVLVEATTNETILDATQLHPIITRERFEQEVIKFIDHRLKRRVQSVHIEGHQDGDKFVPESVSVTISL